MTMDDIVNVNGPVLLSGEATVTFGEPAVDVPAADILILGEKTLDLLHYMQSEVFFALICRLQHPRRWLVMYCLATWSS